ALANRRGMEIRSDQNNIGGTSTGARNVISGNTRSGINIKGNRNDVFGNSIGVDISGSSPLGNGRAGVYIATGNRNRVGNTGAGQGNIIAFNGGNGVRNPDLTSIRNSVLSNSIYSNAKLGIDLGASGVNPPNTAGTNNGQNYAVITAASSAGGVQGTLSSTP